MWLVLQEIITLLFMTSGVTQQTRDIDPMLDNRLRRWLTISPTWDPCLVSHFNLDLISLLVIYVIRLYIADAVAQSVKAVNIDDSAAEPILITTLPQDKLYDVTAFEVSIF